MEAGRVGGLDYGNKTILKKTNARFAAKLYCTLSLFLSLVACDCNLQADMVGARPKFDDWDTRKQDIVRMERMGLKCHKE